MPSLEIPQPAETEAAIPSAQRGRIARLLGRITRPNAGIAAGVEAPEPMISIEDEVSEDFSADMTAWVDGLSTELANTIDQSKYNGARAARSWELISKANQMGREGHQWLENGELIRKGIDARYGAQDKLYATANRLSKRVNRLSQQLDYAKNFNEILEFADEIDPGTYRRFIAEPNQLGRAFNLPPTKTPTTDPQQAADQLNRLPFVKWNDVKQPRIQQHPAITVKGHFDFPTERIIGVASFASWAGRGTIEGTGVRTTQIPNGMGKKGFTPRNLPDMEKTSRGAITDYAQEPYEPDPNYISEANIVIVQDSAGEYWGIATTDGSHRVAAAKLRGEPIVKVGKIEIRSDQDMYQLEYAVRDKVAA